MKKIILLAVALVSLATITSCSKDDDASLQGKWEVLKYGELVNGQEVLVDVTLDPDGCQQDYILITATNTISYNFDDFGSGCEEFIGDPVPYTRNGNIITSSDGTSEIKSLTGSTLKIYSFYEGSISGPTTFITVLKRI
jgi:hypothetical protein